MYSGKRVLGKATKKEIKLAGPQACHQPSPVKDGKICGPVFFLEIDMKITEVLEAVAAVSKDVDSIKLLLQLSKKPVAELSAELLPELKKVVDGLGVYLVDSKAKAVKRFQEEHGFSREEAMLMTRSMEIEMLTALRGKKK